MTYPNRGAYNNQSATVGNTPTKIAALEGVGSGGVLVQNTGANTVYIGDSAVAASGTHLGFSLAAAASVLIPTVGGPADDLYAITASSTSVVVVLFASGA
jgi:hypothetical protein